MYNGGIYSITTNSTNTNTHPLSKPKIIQPSKEDGKRQVKNLAKAQRKISNTKQTRRQQEQRQQFQDTKLPQQILEGNTGRLSYQGHQHLLFRGSQQERKQKSQSSKKGGQNP
jgi:hypothetical protein